MEDEEALKEIENKLDLSLLGDLRSALTEVAQVMHYGALKYSRNNWKKGISIDKVRAALLRHEFKYDNGEMFDKESGLLHLAHRAFWALAELEQLLREESNFVEGDRLKIQFKDPPSKTLKGVNWPSAPRD